MIVQVEDIRELSEQILAGNGLVEEDARIVTDILLEAELRGRPTHGLIRLPGIADRVRAGERVAMGLARSGGAYALIDRSGVDPAAVDDVVFGCCDQIGSQAGDIARTCWLAAGLPDHVPGVTVDRHRPASPRVRECRFATGIPDT